MYPNTLTPVIRNAPDGERELTRVVPRPDAGFRENLNESVKRLETISDGALARVA